MRILFIHNYYQLRGGEDTVFEQEVAQFRDLGHDVEVVAFDNAQFSGSLLTKLSATVLALYNRQSARRVGAAIDAFRPDLVHIHNLFYAASPAVIQAAKDRNVPVVMTLHNYRLVCASGMLMRTGEIPCERCLTKTLPLDGIRFGCFRGSRAQSAQLTAITSLHRLTGIWQRVDRFITLTEFVRQKMLQSSLQLRPGQVVVKPNFVPDLGYSDPAERDDFFLYVGRLSPEKGIDALLDSLNYTTARIDIIGDGPLRPAVEAAAAKHPHLRYRGGMPRDQMADYLRRCRAMILPSIWYEGLPTTILEAFATGTPVICSDQGNLNQIVDHGRTGYLFRTGQGKALAEALQTAQREPGRLAAWGSAGRREFEQQYAEAVVTERLLEIYEGVLQTHEQPVLNVVV